MTETDPSADLRSPSTEKHSRKSSAKAARIIGASARGVEMTKTVERYAPDLIQMIEAGEMSLNAAYQETRRRIIEARQLGLDVPAECRIGGRIKPVNTDPCPHCNGTGRRPAE